MISLLVLVSSQDTIFKSLPRTSLRPVTHNWGKMFALGSQPIVQLMPNRQDLNLILERLKTARSKMMGNGVFHNVLTFSAVLFIYLFWPLSCLISVCDT